MLKMCLFLAAFTFLFFLLNLLVIYNKQEICCVCRIYVNQVFRLGIIVLEYKYAIKNFLFVKHVGQILVFLNRLMWAACAVGKNAALFVMCMNADLWPLQWPLQPPCKFTRGSESPCASSDTVLMEAPIPFSSNSGVRHKQMHAKQINKICSGCVDASSPNISWWMMFGSWILGSTATKKPSWRKNINCILMCEWNLNLSATINKN